MAARIYGDKNSGNCLKVFYILRLLGLAFDWVDVKVGGDGMRNREFLRMNPAGKIPVAVLAGGATLPESNAILFYFARGSRFLPRDKLPLARVLQWMFWEQYSHEPYLAVARFRKIYLQQEAGDRLLENGYRALKVMEKILTQQPFFVGDTATIADIALFPYTDLSPQGGFDLSEFPAVLRWLEKMRELLATAD